MKNITTLVFIFISSLFFSQEMSEVNKRKLQNVQKSTKQYEGKNVAQLLKDLPEIKMVRIAPNMPHLGIHTFIIGFDDNATFSKKARKNVTRERVTIYVKDSTLDNSENLLRFDINTEKAIERFGKLKIVVVL